MKMYKQPYLRPYAGKESRTICPQCKKPHSFTLYLDGNTNQPISPTVGICNHANSCGYHYTPKQYFIDNPHKRESNFTGRPTRIIQRTEPPKPIGLIPTQYLNKTQSTDSNFVYFLTNLFKSLKNIDVSIDELCKTYRLGATKDKRVIFWQVDINGNARTGKMMQYNPTTGKRVHNASGAIDWVHNTLKRAEKLPSDYNLKQCYFGEHLLNEQPDKIVAITESEKTAIICSVLFPQMVWIGAGNLNGLTVEKSKALKGRSIMLFPDLSNPDLPIEKQAFTIWSNKADEIRKTYGCKVVVSDILEKNATEEEKKAGLDIADYLIKQLRQAPGQVTAPPKQLTNITDEADSLEAFFASVSLPDEPMDITPSYTICEPQRFVRGALRAIRSGNYDTEYFLTKLRGLKEVIDTDYNSNGRYRQKPLKTVS
ncbi:MAG: DUF6371 domain-containing protein [Bacteroidales bacterium]|nr:DUF6371 domain-containing protein [Bacteroidales bacterium]